MRANGWGRIVNMTSNPVALAVPGYTHYIATIMAIIGFTRSLATQLAGATPLTVCSTCIWGAAGAVSQVAVDDVSGHRIHQR